MFYVYRIVLAITKAKLYTKVNKNIPLKRYSSAVENRISIVIKISKLKSTPNKASLPAFSRSSHGIFDGTYSTTPEGEHQPYFVRVELESQCA